MSATHTERSEGLLPGPGAPEPLPPLHPRSFKLRFATQCELGRSHVSAVKPLALPATVTDKPHQRQTVAPVQEPLQRVQDMFRCGPRDKFLAPLTSSHEYGWWAVGAERSRFGGGAARLDYRIRDSAWLKERLRVLATDAGYKR